MRIIEQNPDGLLAEARMSTFQRIYTSILCILFAALSIFMLGILISNFRMYWEHARFTLFFNGLSSLYLLVFSLWHILICAAGRITYLSIDRRLKLMRITMRGESSDLFDKVIVIPFDDILEIVSLCNSTNMYSIKNMCTLAIRKKELTDLGNNKVVLVLGFTGECSALESHECVKTILDFWKGVKFVVEIKIAT